MTPPYAIEDVATHEYVEVKGTMIEVGHALEALIKRTHDKYKLVKVGQAEAESIKKRLAERKAVIR